MKFTREELEKLAASTGEPGWVTDLRLKAFDDFESMDLPAEKEEPWRYTDLRRLRFKWDSFSPVLSAEQNLSQDQTGLVEKEGDRAGYVVSQDLAPVLKELDPQMADKGVIFTDLFTALNDHEGLLKEHLFRSFSSDRHIFAALQAAFFSSGVFLFVPKGVEVPLPFEGQTWLATSGGSVISHVVIVAEEASELTYFTRFRSRQLSEPALSLSATELYAGQSARVSCVTLQEYSPEVWHFNVQMGETAKDTTLRNLVVDLGARFSRTETATRMAGDGADVEMLGLYFAERGQHFDFRTLQDHAAGYCRSDLLYKGALKDESHAVYSGLIHVRPEGLETDAYQTNRNLVLSDDARADTKPELEIENNDVRCSHGASVGQINPDELFYLMSRGITQSEAEALIVFGFFEDVISRVRQQEMREVLTDAIRRKLD